LLARDIADLIELGKNHRLIFCRDTNTIVTNFDLDIATALAGGHQNPPANGGVAQRVGNQIGDNAFHDQRIAAQPIAIRPKT